MRRMARASRSQFPASLGATAAMRLSTAIPARKSLCRKSASASRLSAATGLATVPASRLICASSLIALSARSSRWKGLSVVAAETVADRQRATHTAAKPARTVESIDDLPPPRGGTRSTNYDLRGKSCRIRDGAPYFNMSVLCELDECALRQRVGGLHA